MSSWNQLIVELRFSDTSPQEIARELAPEGAESDIENAFNTCIVWAGNLFLDIPKSHRTEYEGGVPTGSTEELEEERRQWLTERLLEYDGIRRVVYNYFYDTPDVGHFYIYRRSSPYGEFEEIEQFDYGQCKDYFNMHHDYLRESAEYIQSKYGIHVLSYREVKQYHHHSWDFDVEEIC